MASHVSDTLVILGNGPSLLQLTEAERLAVSTHDVLAMNGYASHLSKVGIVPTHYLLLDSLPEQQAIFFDALRELENNPAFASTQLWLSPFWINQTQRAGLTHCTECLNWKKIDWTLGRWKKRFWRKGAMWHTCCKLLDLFDMRLRGENFGIGRLLYFWNWRESSPLFSLRSTLVVALALAWRLGYRRVFLLGVDLHSPDHFYAADEAVRAVNEALFGVARPEMHGTALPLGAHPPVQEVVRRVELLYRMTGRVLRCASKESMLIAERSLKYQPLV